MSTALTDDGARVITDGASQATLYVHNKASAYPAYQAAVVAHAKDANLLQAFYQIDECCQLIEKNKYMRIALQFPDELLPDSTSVLLLLKQYFASKMKQAKPKIQAQQQKQIEDMEDSFEKVNSHALEFTSNAPQVLLTEFEGAPEFYIMGDTSYGSCCVDEIAAQHVNADLIIHYGNACLQLVARSPVIHVFGTSYTLQMDTFMDALRTYANGSAQVTVLYELVYASSVPEMEKRVQQEGIKNVHFAKIKRNRVIQFVASEKPVEEATSGSYRSINGLEFEYPENTDIKFFYIGEENVRFTQMIMEYSIHQFARYSGLKNQFDDCYDICSKTVKMLKRRTFLVYSAREAEVFGIIVATVSVKNYMTMVEYAKNLITSRGKRFYIFFVGKLNVPKLANFQDIDMFVLIGCGQNSLIDSKEFFKPIITPYELELALKKGKEWNPSQYLTDFNTLLQTIQKETIIGLNDTNAEEEENTDYSFVTGKMTNYKYNVQKQEDTTTSTVATPDQQALAAVNAQHQQLAILQQSAALQRLQSKQYQGLDPQLDANTPVATIEHGRAGIPKQYDHETDMQ